MCLQEKKSHFPVEIYTCITQGRHCPGNQGKVRENDKGLKWSVKSQVI